MSLFEWIVLGVLIQAGEAFAIILLVMANTDLVRIVRKRHERSLLRMKRQRENRKCNGQNI